MQRYGRDCDSGRWSLGRNTANQLPAPGHLAFVRELLRSWGRGPLVQNVGWVAGQGAGSMETHAYGLRPGETILQAHGTVLTLKALSWGASRAATS